MTEPTNNQTLDVVAVRDIDTPVIDPAMFDQLQDMPEGFSLQSAYLKFETVGHVERAFFVGFTDMMSRNKENGTTLAAVFMWKDPADGAIKRVINAGDNLVKQLQNLPAAGQPIPVKITYLGKKRAKSGNDFNAFDVVVLGGATGSKPAHADAPATDEKPAPTAKVTPEEVIGYLNSIKPDDDRNAITAQVKAYAKALDISLGSPKSLGEALKTLKTAVEAMVTDQIPF